jgi:hypothetical protein
MRGEQVGGESVFPAYSERAALQLELIFTQAETV